MNERIKQLWDTAAKLESDPSWEGQTKFMEKFAELIVRECIDTVLDSSVEYCTRPQIAKELKEHFGVES
jgi:hypothetical protein